MANLANVIMRLGMSDVGLEQCPSLQYICVLMFAQGDCHDLRTAVSINWCTAKARRVLTWPRTPAHPAIAHLPLILSASVNLHAHRVIHQHLALLKDLSSVL